MTRHKLLIMFALCMMITVQSCVHGDLDDCPPMVNYAMAFTYLKHTGEGDRFYDEVKKINLYVFDNAGFVYTTTTELSPYSDNFNIPLNLPSGNYHIIAWGNVLESAPFKITPDDFVKGQTTLGEAYLSLQRTADSLSSSELENLFYGDIDVDVPLYVSRVDTISLINDTKHVRVVTYWDKSDYRGADSVTYDNVIVQLIAPNAKFDFNNEIPDDSEDVTYQPYRVYRADTIASKNKPSYALSNAITVSYYPDNFKKAIDSVVYDFCVLQFKIGIPQTLVAGRMVTIDSVLRFQNFFVPLGHPDRWDNKYGVRLTTRDKDNEDEGFCKVIADRRLYDTNDTKTGRDTLFNDVFDRYENYQVNAYFLYDDANATWSSGGIHIVDWHNVDQGSFGGAD